MNKISKVFNKTKNKVSAVALSTLMTAEMAVGNAYADTDPAAKHIVAEIIGVIVDIFPLIGIFFVVAGVFKLILAYRNNQPEDQTSAAKDIVIGAVFIVFRAFVFPAISGLL